MARTVFSPQKLGNPVRGLIFDMDGVLFDTERDSVSILCQMGKEMGLAITPEFIIANMGMNVHDLTIIYRNEFGPSYHADEFWEEYWKRRDALYKEKGPRIKEGAKNLLVAADKAGIPCVVSSSSPSKEVWKNLELTSIDRYFKNVVGGEMCEHSKPFPDIFLAAARILGLRPDECVVIEDSMNGLKASHAAGMITCFVRDLPDYSHEELEKVADFSFDSAEEIAELFSNQHAQIPLLKE